MRRSDGPKIEYNKKGFNDPNSNFFESHDSYEYDEKCSNCKNILTVRTQRDNDPEYYTKVYVLCNCKNWVKFKLPVN